MGLPAKRRTKQSKRERASHFAIGQVSLIACSHCKRMIRSHHVCRYCGYYQGREVIAIKLPKSVAKNAKKSDQK